MRERDRPTKLHNFECHRAEKKRGMVAVDESKQIKGPFFATNMKDGKKRKEKKRREKEIILLERLMY